MRSDSVPARVGVAEEHRCTEFTSDHGLSQSEESDVFGAAVCPGCQKRIPLTGDPTDFHEQVVRCMGCTHMMVLDGRATLSRNQSRSHSCTHMMVLDGPALIAFESEVGADAA
jgi:hypothetical protein